MKDIIVALLIKDAICLGASLLLGIIMTLLILGADRLARLKRERRHRKMLELKQDLERTLR